MPRIAEGAGVQFIGSWIGTDGDTMAARIGARADDPLDTDTEILDRQLDEGV